MIRGDRRQMTRPTPDRRSRVRTPGAFKNACDTAFEAIRRMENERFAALDQAIEERKK